MSKLGILDWGIGGFGLYKLIKEREDISVVYLSDAGYTPYGKVPAKELKNRILKCTAFLQEKGAEQIGIACNAAGSVVLDQPFSNIIYAGQLALKEHSRKNIGVIGGKRLVESQIFPSMFPKANIHQEIAQNLSGLIEAGKQDTPEMIKELKKVLNPIKDAEVLLLACTHYPAVADKIQAVYKNNVSILDPAEILSKQILWEHSFEFGNDEIYTTGDTELTQKSANMAFDVEINLVKKIEL